MRIPGWQRSLNEYVIEAQERYKRDGFAYGSFDCVHFAADWVLKLTGTDHLAAYRGQYATAEEGAEKLAELDGGSLRQALVNRFGEPVHPIKAMRGDIAYAQFGGQECCGILFTSGARMVALFLAEGGFALHRAQDVEHAFRVE